MTATQVDFTVVAEGLEFPEGPIALPDGSFLVVEIAGKRLTQIAADGTKRVVAELGGGPNGAAIGPDGRCYVCNNGGLSFSEVKGRVLPGTAPEDYAGGWIEAVDLETGAREILYRSCGDIPLRAPNDIVFDATGGFWFTDSGKMFKRHKDRGAVFYARPDGSDIRQCVFPSDSPNGIGLSPDDKTLYVAETHTARIMAFSIGAPGEITRLRGPVPWEKGHLLAVKPDYALFDSMAVDSAGNILVGDIPNGGISVFSPDGTLLQQIETPDMFTTNVCFGGPDLTTAYATFSTLGQLVAFDWPRPGVPLHWLNRMAAA